MWFYLSRVCGVPGQVFFLLLHQFICVIVLLSEPPGPPSIRLNSDLIPNQSDVALTAGSAFSLSCHGNGSVHLSSTAFRLLYVDKLMEPLVISRAEPRHTGTYRCGYTNQSLEHLNSWIHLYITGKTNASHAL